MPRPVLTRDLSDPDFPHGTPVGYQRGCRKRHADACPAPKACVDVQTARSKANALLRHRGTPRIQGIDPTETRKHVETLLRLDPYLTINEVARAAGVANATVQSVLAGRHKTVKATIADMILDVGPGVASRRPIAPTVELVRRMQANGWPVIYQARTAGHDIEWALQAPSVRQPQKWIAASTAIAFERLALSIGHSVATPGPGLAVRDIGRARNIGKERGYVGLRASSIHRFAWLRTLLSSDEISAIDAGVRHRLDERFYERVKADLGLSTTYSKVAYGGKICTATFADPAVARAVKVSFQRMDIDPAALDSDTWTAADISSDFDPKSEWKALQKLAGTYRPHSQEMAAMRKAAAMAGDEVAA